jgi:hypothetical protein
MAAMSFRHRVRWRTAIGCAGALFALAASLALKLGLFTAGGARVTRASSAEVEAMTLPAKAGYVFAESPASGGKAFKFLGNGVASERLTISGPARAVVLRARGTQCSGAPVATVTIDGRQRLRSAVASTIYSDYGADVSLPRGTHVVRVAFVNDRMASSCDRNLYADKVMLLDRAIASAPPAASPAATAAPVGQLLFASGFESGVAPPWGGIQACPSQGKSAISTVARPVLSGSRSMKAWVSGTCSFGSQRAEVLNAGSQYRYTEGQELYFADSVYFPANFPATQKGHCITMQIHTLQRGEQATSPAFSVWCRDAAGHTNTVMLRTGAPGCQWQTPMVRSVWHNFVVRMKFSTSSSVGSWDLWYGTGTHPTYVEVARNCASNALLSATDYGYYKVGLYRGLENADTATVYHDNVRVGTSFDAVTR